jgi:hypothetical protein
MDIQGEALGGEQGEAVVEQDGAAPVEQQDAPALNEVEKIAAELGWSPKDQWRGEQDKWQDASSFLKAGREITKTVKGELRSVRQTLDTLTRTSADMMADRLAQQKAELEARLDRAVEEGDTAAVRTISREAAQLDAKAPVTPDATVNDFIARHTWFNSDPAARAVAVAEAGRLGATGASVSDQLAAAEAAVRRRFPEHFPDAARMPAKAPPAVAAPQSRSAAPQSRTKGWDDLPAEAKSMGNSVISRVGGTKDDFAKRYWSAAGQGKAA